MLGERKMSEKYVREAMTKYMSMNKILVVPPSIKLKLKNNYAATNTLKNGNILRRSSLTGIQEVKFGKKVLLQAKVKPNYIL